MDARGHGRLVALSALVQGLYALRHLAVMPFLAMALGAAEFGVWSRMIAAINLLVPLMGLGLMQAMERYLPSEVPDVQGRRLWTAVFLIFIVGLSATAAVKIGVFPIAWCAGVLHVDAPFPEQQVAMTWLLLCATVMALAQTAQNALRLMWCHRAYAMVSALYFVLLCGGAIVLWLLSLGRERDAGSAVALYAIVGAAVFIVGAIIAMDSTRVEGTLHSQLDVPFLRAGIRYGAPLLPAALFSWAMVYIDRFMLTACNAGLTDVDVGLYAAQYTLGSAMLLVFGPFTLFLMPVVVRYWDAADRAGARAFLRRSLAWAVAAALPALVLGTWAGPVLLRYLTGGVFANGTALVLGGICAGYFLTGLAAMVQVPLQCAGATGRILLHTLCAAGANILLNLLLIPRTDALGGLAGAAMATAVSGGVLCALHAIAAYRCCADTPSAAAA